MVSVFCWLFGRLITKTGLFFALLEIVLAFIKEGKKKEISSLNPDLRFPTDCLICSL